MENSKQTTDAAQGGEGTQSFHGKSYDALTKSMNESKGPNLEQSRDVNLPPITDGTA